ncbi:MAG: S8 family serine peptidase [Verrucomicrobiales bacterium]|nr:S8 family serine peptidase [Verrucomicrobiales bacterium]
MNAFLPDRHLWLTAEQAHRAREDGTGAGIKVAIIDSGIDFTHPDLATATIEDNVVLTEEDGSLVVRDTGEAFDPHGHGTAVASILHRTAPQARLGSFRVFEAEQAAGSGRVIRGGVELALKRGYQIINCSFGIRGQTASGRLSFFAENKEWADRAFFAGQHVVAACNNENHAATEWPAHFTSVVTVDGIHCDDDELFWSPGDFADFGARGVDVEVAWTRHERLRVDGSSYAAPRVAGWIARILSVHPQVDPVQMKGLLRLLAYERPRFRLQSGRSLARGAGSTRPRG